MHVAIAAKSCWSRTVRREHALAAAGARHGARITFLEAPADVRSLRARGPRRWVRELARPSVREVLPGVEVLSRAAPVPGHRGAVPEAVDAALLRRRLRALLAAGPVDAVVVQLPWQWAATAGLPVRRVFDAADDWTALIPGRDRIAASYRRIAREADVVVVASEGLGELFPGAPSTVVPNGVDTAFCTGAPAPAPRARRLAYAGTLSERFDAPLVADLLDLLPGWRLDLYGECRYAGRGGRVGDELAGLLQRHPGRARWHGPVPRSGLAQVLDAADVLLVPNRPDRSRGQSSMKILDYAARGRPVVTTRWDPDADRQLAPGTAVVRSAREAADAVTTLAVEDAAWAESRVRWARARSWDHRWPEWSAAVTGAPSRTRSALHQPVGGP